MTFCLPDGVGTIALIHTAGAFALLTFLIAQVERSPDILFIADNAGRTGF